MSYLWTKIVNVSPDTSSTCTPPVLTLPSPHGSVTLVSIQGLLGDSYSSLIPWRHWGWHQRWLGEKLWHLQGQAKNRRDSLRYIGYEKKWQLQRWMLEWPEEATVLNSKHAMSFSIFRWLDKLLHLSASILLLVIHRMWMQKWLAKRNKISFKDTELTSKCGLMN